MKKDPKKNHAKVFFTQNYMFDAKEIKHCTKKMLKFYEIHQQDIINFNIII